MAKILGKIEQIHRNAMHMKVQGWTIAAIAKQLRKSKSTVEKWFYVDDLFREEFTKFKDELVETGDARMKYLIQQAIDTLQNSLSNPDVTNTQVTAAKDILDRAGLKAVQKQEVKMDGQLNTKHEFDEKLLEDPETAKALKVLFDKMSDEDE